MVELDCDNPGIHKRRAMCVHHRGCFSASFAARSVRPRKRLGAAVTPFEFERELRDRTLMMLDGNGEHRSEYPCETCGGTGSRL